jgi:hypothetical protein
MAGAKAPMARVSAALAAQVWTNWRRRMSIPFRYRTIPGVNPKFSIAIGAKPRLDERE